MDDREIIVEFVTESREHLADVENQLLAIEAAGAQADPELVNTVFRSVHSIKGAAGFLGFSTVGQLAHDLENVLNLVRNRQLVPDTTVTNTLLRSADKLRAMIDDIDHSNGVDVSEHLDALQRIVARLLSEELPAVRTQPEPGDKQEDRDGQNEKTNSNGSSQQSDASMEGISVNNHDLTAPAFSSHPDAVMEGSDTSCHPATPAAPGTAHGESSIRVGVNILDRLMNLAGELVLARNQLIQTAATGDQSAWGHVSARVNQVTSELQETIMQTRLQPIGTVFGRFPRVVRDLSNTLAKQCQLTVEGQEVELDKSIIEAISDPLTHLIRNSVDHGIERPEVRSKAGKSPTGTVALRAFHQAGKVGIEIRDDGRGIDPAKLKEKAVAAGVLTPEQARGMSDREALLLIFRPGFSLAERVTEVSGRGVGMDVVKTNIERLGGTVAVDTQLGVGTTIHVRLPLTLAIIPSLVVRSEHHRYAIPQASIRELVRVRASDVTRRIERVKRAEVFRLRGSLLPLVRLGNLLNLQGPASADGATRAVNIIVVEAGHLRYGLVVDSLCDSEEIVVKPLGRHMQGCTCLAGATILGDGKVALILDIAGMASQAHLAASTEDAVVETDVKGTNDDSHSLLLFKNHPTEHFGIPMELVTRLERVRAEQLDSVGGQQVLQYRGGTLPLLALEQYVACKPRTDAAKVYVVVFATAGREVGLLVPQLVDIRSVPAHFDTGTFREPGVVGSFVYEQMTVRLLDLHELNRKAHPDWYDAHSAAQPPDGLVPRILVVEDSDFFRKQLIGFFEAEGYQVEGFEDGAQAWNALRRPENRFDLVVTDIEMPNMDGWQLTQHVRDDARLADLPIVAVTSLAAEDDIRHGQEVGVTEYHVKLDRERLTTAVSRLLRESLHKAASGSSR